MKKVKKVEEETTSLAVVKKESNVIIAASQALVIKTADDALKAVDFLKRIKEAKAKLDAFFDPQNKAAYNTWQIGLNHKKEYMTPLITAEKLIKEKKTMFDLAQEEAAEKERQKIEDAARKKEEQIKAKLQKKIDKTSDEETKAILEEQKESVHVQREAGMVETKTEGSAKQADYSVEVHNTAALLRAILDEEIQLKLDNIVEIKIKSIKDFIKITNITNIPGCTIKKTFIQKVL
jgi:hypothetical protein